jgi:hypothetical protein
VPPTDAITDQQVATVLSSYAGMVDRILSDPGRWLGMDEDPPPTAPFPARALDAVRDRAFGETTPASAGWSREPVDDRVDWWVRRIGVSAGLAAAAPRFFGALANRVPLQGALGAAAAGLAVCATAREHGTTSPEDWVPLLATVLFDRHLEAPGGVPAARESERRLTDTEADGDGVGAGEETSGGMGAGARRAAGTVWSLARALLALGDLLDHRPRGGRLVRVLAQVPVVGVASGWLDERGGIRRAAGETTRLLGTGSQR